MLPDTRHISRRALAAVAVVALAVGVFVAVSPDGPPPLEAFEQTPEERAETLESQTPAALRPA